MAASMSRSLYLRNVANFTAVRNFHLSAKRCESFNVQDEDDFKERVLGSSVPVIVDFHATWCGPCKLLGPRLESIMSAYKEKVHLAKIDVDENEEIAFQYDVTAVPAVVAIKDGKEVDKFVGLKDEDEIKTFIDKLCGL